MIKEWLKQGAARGTEQRGHALGSLYVPFSVSLSGLVVCAATGGPFWLLVFLATLTGLFTTAYVGAYGYFMIKKPDALRSEKFTLEKMAIEKGLMGDNIEGLLEADVLALGEPLDLQSRTQLSEHTAAEDD